MIIYDKSKYDFASIYNILARNTLSLMKIVSQTGSMKSSSVKEDIFIHQVGSKVVFQSQVEKVEDGKY